MWKLTRNQILKIKSRFQEYWELRKKGNSLLRGRSEILGLISSHLLKEKHLPRCKYSCSKESIPNTEVESKHLKTASLTLFPNQMTESQKRGSERATQEPRSRINSLCKNTSERCNQRTWMFSSSKFTRQQLRQRFLKCNLTRRALSNSISQSRISFRTLSWALSSVRANSCLSKASSPRQISTRTPAILKEKPRELRCTESENQSRLTSCTTLPWSNSLLNVVRPPN